MERTFIFEFESERIETMVPYLIEVLKKGTEIEDTNMPIYIMPSIQLKPAQMVKIVILLQLSTQVSNIQCTHDDGYLVLRIIPTSLAIQVDWSEQQKRIYDDILEFMQAFIHETGTKEIVKRLFKIAKMAKRTKKRRRRSSPYGERKDSGKSKVKIQYDSVEI
jgi:hypothetical protein